MNTGLKEFETKSPVNVHLVDNVIQGFNPANFMFGYTYHSSMIPPFKPGNMLILGYGIGTIAELTRKIWGMDTKITCVDITLPDPLPYREYSIVVSDALEFCKQATSGIVIDRYDYIVVDLYNGAKETDFVYDEEFVSMVRKMSRKLISVNSVTYNMDLLKPYYNRYEFDRTSSVGNNMVTFWRVKD